MLALGEDHRGKVWQMLDEEEIKEISQAMADLGTVAADVVEKLLVEFVSRMSATGSIMGSFEATERLLRHYPAAATRSTPSWRKSAVRPVAPCGTSSAT